jgi:hypothetical protein
MATQLCKNLLFAAKQRSRMLNQIGGNRKGRKITRVEHEEGAAQHASEDVDEEEDEGDSAKQATAPALAPRQTKPRMQLQPTASMEVRGRRLRHWEGGYPHRQRGTTPTEAPAERQASPHMRHLPLPMGAVWAADEAFAPPPQASQ